MIWKIILVTRVSQKLRSGPFCLFFFGQHWNKLPRGEFLGGLYDHTVKIWKLNVCFSSCFSLVKVDVPVAIIAKFEMCVAICFLHAEGQPAIWNSNELVSENLKWDAPSPWSRIGLNYIFSFWNISKMDFKGKRTEKWLGIPSNWSLEILKIRIT